MSLPVALRAALAVAVAAALLPYAGRPGAGLLFAVAGAFALVHVAKALAALGLQRSEEP
jgi:hypothetical protein